MTPPSFFHPDAGPDPEGRELSLDADEARHVRSLRLRPGDEMRITDGASGLWRARLEQVGEGPPAAFRRRLRTPRRLSRWRWASGWAPGIGRSSRWRRPWGWGPSPSSRWSSTERAPWPTPGVPTRAGGRRAAGPWPPRSSAAGPACRRSARCATCTTTWIGRDARGRTDRRKWRGPRSCRTGRRAGGWGASRGDGGARTLRLLAGPEGGLEEDGRRVCRQAGFRMASLGPRVLRFETVALAALAVAADRLGTSGEGRTNA